MNNNRENYLDFAKGVAIFLVVLGHLIDKKEFSNVFSIISSFHMPFFFFLSGIAMHYTKMDTNRYLLRKMINLLLPFIFVGGGLAYYSKGYMMLSAYWYLPVLFVFSIVTFVNKYLWHKKFFLCILLDLFFIFSIAIVILKCDVRFVYSLAFYTTAYIVPFVAGVLYPYYKNRINGVVYLCCLIAIFLLTPHFSGFVHHSIYMHILKNIIGISMTLLLLTLFQKVNYIDNKYAGVVCYVGRKTLPIYLFHYFIIPTCVFYGEVIGVMVNAIISFVIIAISILVGEFVSLSSVGSFFVLGKIPERMKHFFY